MRVYSLLVLLLLILSACESKPISSGPEVVIVEGFVFDEFFGGIMPMSEVSVNINGTTYHSNEEGKLMLIGIPIGEYEVSFSSEYHHELDTVLTFEYLKNSPDTFEVELQSIMLDIIPLEIGNTWKYQIETEMYRHEQGCIENCSGSQFEIGTESVEVVGIEENDLSYTYTMQETIEGFYVNEENDTTYFNEQGSYLITEDKENSLISTDYTNSASFNIFHGSKGPLYGGKVLIQTSDRQWGYFSSIRYVPYSRNKSKHTIPVEGFYKIAVDTGTVSYHYEYSGHNGSGSYKKELISFEDTN